MAVSKQEIKSTYPLPVYNYVVEIAGATVGFAEASGLNIEYHTTTYKESPTAGGAAGPRVMHMPAQGTPTNLTLKKGLVKGVSVPVLYDWINSIQLNQVEKKDIFIRLCDEKGDAVISWKVVNAFPIRLDVPEFSAESDAVAVETLELMADTLQVD